MKKIIALVLLICFGFSACEKDDICDPDTPTTPRLVIEFYDAQNPTILKTVTNLKVIGQGMTEGIVFNENATDDTKYLTSGSKVSVPLKTNEDTCTFSFILNSGNSNTQLINTDVITFKYNRNNVFVSRACGFKTLFYFSTSDAVTRTDGPETDGIWMSTVILENSTIENENEAHIKVYF